MLRKHGLMTKTFTESVGHKHERLFRKMISAKELDAEFDGEREISLMYS